MARNSKLAFGLASLLALVVACSAPPAPSTTPAVSPTATPVVPTSTPTVAATATVTPSPPPTATPVPSGSLTVRTWNGKPDEVHLDGATVPLDGAPHQVAAGAHQVAALIGQDVVAIVDVSVPPAGHVVADLTLPPSRAPLAVVVENAPEARPQSGLGSADIVYEALAEGGIARFLAVYLNGEAASVGPVRSLRHYFAFMAAEYGADLVHIGASPQGFAWRDAMGLGRLDESAGDPGVWRSRARAAPHNAYTSTENARQLLAARGRATGSGWGPIAIRTDGAYEPKGEPALELRFRFAPWPYAVSYAWDESVGGYRRWMSGVPHVDAETGQQLAPTTVVVQQAEVSPIPGDTKGRVDIGLSDAEGPLLVFSRGQLIAQGTWQKTGPDQPTHWFAEDGSPVTLPPGPIWVEVLPLSGGIAW